MIRIRRSLPCESNQVIDIWRSAVEATHGFLTPKDRDEIEKEVVVFFSQTPVWVATNQKDEPLGFMFLHDGHLEALFIAAPARGQQIGRKLMQHALALYPNLSLDVNEQNHQAIGFYEHMGFQISGRSELDGQGRPYPLLHLHIPTKA